jgi:hypothetical protein
VKPPRANYRDTCKAERHMDDPKNIELYYSKRYKRIYRQCAVCNRAAKRDYMRRVRSSVAA